MNQIEKYLDAKYDNYKLIETHGLGYCYISPSMYSGVKEAYIAPGYIVTASTNGATHYIEGIITPEGDIKVFEMGTLFTGAAGAPYPNDADHNSHNTYILTLSISTILTLILSLFLLQHIYKRIY